MIPTTPILIVLTCASTALAADPPTGGLTLELGNTVTLTLVRIPAGTFLMGSPDAKEQHEVQHAVTITKPYFIGIHEVTQAQYQQIMGVNPVASGNPENVGLTKPVAMQTWPEAVEFCAKLSAKTGRTARLPTEAQWEYAARAGTTTTWSFGDDAELRFDYCWSAGSAGGHFTHPVGELKPNPWGLYDVHGNVMEMTADWWAPYPSGPAVDPQGPAVGPPAKHDKPVRVCRGGSFYAGVCPVLDRYGFPDDDQKRNIGFRIVVLAE